MLYIGIGLWAPRATLIAAATCVAVVVSVAVAVAVAVAVGTVSKRPPLELLLLPLLPPTHTLLPLPRKHLLTEASSCGFSATNSATDRPLALATKEQVSLVPTYQVLVQPVGRDGALVVAVALV
jgi:hypothetical protein